MEPVNALVAAIFTMRRPLASAAGEACAAVGVSTVAFDGVTPPAAPVALVIAELNAGNRRVPQNVLDAVSHVGGRARLLLLCSETLVRPHVCTQGGRVMMASPPHTPGRLANRIRMLLAGTEVKAGSSSLQRTERFAERCWVSTFQSEGTPPGVVMQRVDGSGMTCVLSPPGTQDTDALLEKVVELLARERSDEARLSGLARLAGSSGVLHLYASSDRWLFAWPDPRWPLHVHSPQRLPSHADIATRSPRQTTWSMLAAPGDLVLACAAPMAIDPTNAELGRALEEGGPAAVDLLGATAQRANIPLSGVAVEVNGWA